uniref:NADH-ubiquinone oxidoreductase chain 5 n=1 Tax=Contacyphon sp. BT0012 TaxID=546486 RepID=B6D8T8_9COLE|nr:NADH dehydrogenase subunit 5 [Contacyphon sp. BT0012]ACF35076.1 NADH dehydrogenase subunit 5 [Contacyphon sp. BT0012]
MKYISICYINFIVLLLFSLTSLFYSLMFIIKDLILFIEWELISFNSSSFSLTILLDWMSLMFMGFVMFISSMVILYSEEYMSGDLNINRFIMLVIMFVLSMILLIISPNIVSILLGWDGLGLVSYCLVIYYQNVKSYNAGMITALSNRIGDVALLLSISWMINYGSFNYIFYLNCMSNDFTMQLISWLVVLAAFTKSAQIPFSSWLPAAMAAPTPVSSLVHSSTLVTAGVYLLIRFNFIFGDFLMMSMLLISSLTMFMSGLGANFEFDLKKVIALSTLSQLGLMMSILFLGNYKLAFFHLLTHAMFKALLFMCAGSVIHNFSNSQDIRFMGSLMLQMPLTCTFFNISNLALCGFPFLAGFYSKDLILEVCSLHYGNMLIYFLFYFSTGLTMCYSLRLCYYSIIGNLNFNSFYNLGDNGIIMLKGMSGLFLMVIFSGSSLSWLIFPTPTMICLPLFMKLMALLVSLFGGFMGYSLAKMSVSFSSNSYFLVKYLYFISSMWYMPYLSTLGVNYYFLKLGSLVIKNFDQGWSEYLGGQGIYKFLGGLSKSSQLMEVNNLKIYLLMFILWLVILIIFI